MGLFFNECNGMGYTKKTKWHFYGSEQSEPIAMPRRCLIPYLKSQIQDVLLAFLSCFDYGAQKLSSLLLIFATENELRIVLLTVLQLIDDTLFASSSIQPLRHRVCYVSHSAIQFQMCSHSYHKVCFFATQRLGELW